MYKLVVFFLFFKASKDEQDHTVKTMLIYAGVASGVTVRVTGFVYVVYCSVVCSLQQFYPVNSNNSGPIVKKAV